MDEALKETRNQGKDYCALGDLNDDSSLMRPYKQGNESTITIVAAWQ